MIRTLPSLLLLFGLLCGPLAQAAKVKLGADNWNHPSGKDCVSCHSKASAGLTEQWRHSAHAKAQVNCMDCHQADPDDADAITHEGQVIATIVSPKDCGRCHSSEFEQQQGSVHAQAASLLDAAGSGLIDHLSGAANATAGCAQCHGSEVRMRGDGTLDPATWPNTGIGRINPDGSRGSCSSCHGRHAFSRAQARTPEACNPCHQGAESPDREVFEGSAHFAALQSQQSEMNYAADSWIAGKDYSAAPTCATCHMGAAGKLPTSHDVGMRNAWKLTGPVSQKQYLVMFKDGDKRNLPVSEKPPKRGSSFPKADGTDGEVKVAVAPKQRRQAMSMVCRECHGSPFVKGFMDQFDDLVELYNEKFAAPAAAIMEQLYLQDKLTRKPFDEPLELTYRSLWHDAGTAARHGASMGSPHHVWSAGMEQVAQIFYREFLPQARALGGDRLVDEQLAKASGQAWLQPEPEQHKAGPTDGSDHD